MLLEARSLGLTRGSRWLFTSLSLNVAAGQLLILRGPNGVGKTSLLRVLAGLTLPDEGQVLIRGQGVRALSFGSRTAMLYSGHANSLKDDFTTEENLADQLALDANDASAAQQLAALKIVGLFERREVLARRLSQGQKRRIGLARLRLNAGLAHKPIWLLDEPTNALDAEGTALFLQTVDQHVALGGVAVIATHLPLNFVGEVVELILGGQP